MGSARKLVATSKQEYERARPKDETTERKTGRKREEEEKTKEMQERKLKYAKINAWPISASTEPQLNATQIAAALSNAHEGRVTPFVVGNTGCGRPVVSF